VKELSTPADTIYSSKKLFNNKTCNRFVKRKFGGLSGRVKKCTGSGQSPEYPGTPQ
jgi:hypothetical protein